MAATATSASRSHRPRAKRSTLKLRGDGKPHEGLINMLEHAIATIEAGNVDEGRKLAGLAGEGCEGPFDIIELVSGIDLVADMSRVDQATFDALVGRCRAESQDSRRTERLIALWHYENEHGCSIHENLPDVFQLATEALNSISPGDEDMTPEQMDRADRDALLIGDRILLALVESGHYDKAAAYVEQLADKRRACDVRNGSPRSIPFDRNEWFRLLKEQGCIDEHSGLIRPRSLKAVSA